MNQKCAFYGSLREGKGNRRWCEASVEAVTKTTISGYKMRSLGGYPFVVKTSDPSDLTVVELVTVMDNDTFNQIDGMEIQAGYIRDTIIVDDEEWLIYLYPEDYPEYEEVIGGDWTKFDDRA